MTEPTLSNIDHVRAIPADVPGRWTVTFRSAHTTHHQVYLNGVPAGVTDSPEQRQITVRADEAPAELLVAAVGEADRFRDLSALLSIDPPGWIVRRQVPADPALPDGTLLQLLLNPTAPDQRVLDSCPAWPADQPRFGLGLSAFGRGGFGLDAVDAPGLGMGAAGLGPFGTDAPCRTLRAVCPETGSHVFAVAAVAPDGSTARSAEWTRHVALPPAPPEPPVAVACDPAAGTLTLQIK